VSPKSIAIRPYPTLKAWREAHGFTMQEAADSLGVSQPVYIRLEHGKRFLKGQLAKAIMEKTQVPLEQIVGAA